MKKNFVFFLMLFIPGGCLGLEDACNSPTEYTVDKRCYVTDVQKQIRPFNAVVGLVDEDDSIYCTGTIVELKDSLYVFTAAHCADFDGDNLPDSTIRVKLQDNRFFYVNGFINSNFFEFVESGEGEDLQKHFRSVFAEDWAIYKFQNVENVPFVNPTNQLEIDIFSKFRFDYDALSVGYGGLKIMSDQDIENFKRSYVDFLREYPLPSGESRDKINERFVRSVDVIDSYRSNKQNISYELQTELGFERDGGIHIMYPVVIFFLSANKDLYDSLFRDNDKLKVSYCKFVSSGLEKNCQTWGGNSGGAVFENNGNLMGIHTKGNAILGGPNHAGAGGGESLLKPNLWSKNPIIDSINEASQKQ